LRLIDLDVAAGVLGDMFRAGIVDPVKVCYSAVCNAGWVAGTLTTTTSRPDPRAATAALDLTSRLDFIRIEPDVHADNGTAIALYEKFGSSARAFKAMGADRRALRRRRSHGTRRPWAGRLKTCGEAVTDWWGGP